ncbi:hypothetical protein MP638_005392 [Amoeboaphelidium occidentale]|nr:hypothetical protein MP638_005392 [Amoeboaphelidium occidentale]
MNLIDLLTCLLAAIFGCMVLGLEHDKSFLLPDGASNVYTVVVYKDSLLLTASNDIIQKDISTGMVQRTFRAHENIVNSFVVTNDSRMITSAYDDMIIVWSLDYGSILKRIWLRSSGTYVQSISVRDDQLFTAGEDTNVRQVDLVSGRIVQRIGNHTAFIDHLLDKDINGKISSIVARGDFLYIGKQNSPHALKLVATTGEIDLSFVGHTNTVVAIDVYQYMLFSGSADATIIYWNVNTGDIIRIFIGHEGGIYAVLVVGEELYSAGAQRGILKWNISNGQILTRFPDVHNNAIKSLTVVGRELFSGSFDTTAIRWDIVTGEPLFTYSGRSRKNRAVVTWTNFVISGGEDAEIRMWDASFDSVNPITTIANASRPISCLFVYNNSLFSGSADLTADQWELPNFQFVRKYTGPKSAILSIAADQLFLYAGGYEETIYQWDIVSGSQNMVFEGHTSFVESVFLNEETLYSGSNDKSIRAWKVTTQDSIGVFNTLYNVFAILIKQNSIISCTGGGLEAFSVESQEKIGYLREPISCLCITANRNRVVSGHSDSIIRSRDPTTLQILETYQGHLDIIYSICFDELFVMYSTGFDGSIKKWNLATRKIAFSFEDRNSSVTTLAAHGNLLFVGVRRGTILIYNIESALLTKTLNAHEKDVTTLQVTEDSIISSGLDGLIMEFSLNNTEDFSLLQKSRSGTIRGFALNSIFLVAIEDESTLISISWNDEFIPTKIADSQAPLTCVAVTEYEIIAGSRSGAVYTWSLDTKRPYFQLKGHVSQVNSLLVVNEHFFSTSDDKTIIEWSLNTRNLIKVYKRISATALGHLGRVYSVSFCSGTLFSVGADLSVRRWNIPTGKHEDVYFGFSKPVTSVLCYNNSVFAGSEDFSVLVFNPNLPSEPFSFGLVTKSTLRNAATKRTKAVKRLLFDNTNSSIGLIITYIIIALSAVIAGSLVCYFLLNRSKDKGMADSLIASSQASQTNMISDLETVINTVIGISKHAAYLIDASFIAKVKKITQGGGGELYIAKIMDASLRAKFGEVVVQKIILTTSKSLEDAFYQEVGIMIMLNTFPHFCSIVGYTEKPLSIILKYYPDGSLHDWIKANSFGSGAVLKAMKDISEALKVMHSLYLAHCDLKPQNILIRLEGNLLFCYLTDFGITQILSDQIIATTAFNVINIRGLSVHYAAPESFVNFRRKNYVGADFKKYDIYSYACVIYELLKQRMPWN